MSAGPWGRTGGRSVPTARSCADITENPPPILFQHQSAASLSKTAGERKEKGRKKKKSGIKGKKRKQTC